MAEGVDQRPSEAGSGGVSAPYGDSRDQLRRSAADALTATLGPAAGWRCPICLTGDCDGPDIDHRPLTVDEVRRRLDWIRTIAHDDTEAAHGVEDDLRHEVLANIALGMTADPAELAAAVLASSDIAFDRWAA